MKELVHETIDNPVLLTLMLMSIGVASAHDLIVMQWWHIAGQKRSRLSAVCRSTVISSIVEARNNVACFQLHHHYAPAVGEVTNNAVETRFAGVATPEEAAAALEEIASFELSSFLNEGWKMWIVKPIRQNCPFHIFHCPKPPVMLARKIITKRLIYVSRKISSFIHSLRTASKPRLDAARVEQGPDGHSLCVAGLHHFRAVLTMAQSGVFSLYDWDGFGPYYRNRADRRRTERLDD